MSQGYKDKISQNIVVYFVLLSQDKEGEDFELKNLKCHTPSFLSVLAILWRARRLWN